MKQQKGLQMFLKQALLTCLCLVATLIPRAAAALNGSECRDLSASARGDDALFVQTEGRYKRIGERATAQIKRLDMDRAFVFVPRGRLANRALVILTKTYGSGGAEIRTVRIERRGFRDENFDLTTYNQYHRNGRDNVVLARKFHFAYDFGGARRRTDDPGRRERFLFEGVEDPSTTYSGVLFRGIFSTPAFAADERPVRLKSQLYDQNEEPPCIDFTVEGQPGTTQMFIQIDRLDQSLVSGRLKWHLQQAGN
jgi:hypothetical protein